MKNSSNTGMNRRSFLSLSAATGVSFPFVQTLSRVEASGSSRKRNIIFILIDDMRFDAMSCMGHPFLQTPHLDRLAAGGVLFENAFVTTSLCSPSRACFLSGEYAHIHGVLNNSTLLPKGTPTFPLELQKAGYDTAFIGKWHMGGSTDKPRPGFHHWVSFRGQGVYVNPTFNVDGQHVKRNGHVSDLLTEYAADWLKKKRNAPFCLYLSHKAVHAMFEPPERHKNAYADVKIPHPASMANTEENYAGKPLWVRRQRHSWHGVDYMYHDQIGYDEFVLGYNRTMLSVDDSIGEIMNTLEDLGLLESTLILFTSDNGFLFGEHGLIDKRCMYEESIKIPMIAHCPEMIPAGRRTQRLVLNIDIAPTILDAGGLPVPKTVQGMSFLPIARGENPKWRDAILYEYFWEEAFPQTPTVLGVRTEDYKYMWYYGIFDLKELYNLKEDPHEMANLIDDPKSFDIRQAMQKRLQELLKQYGATRIPSFRGS